MDHFINKPLYISVDLPPGSDVGGTSETVDASEKLIDRLTTLINQLDFTKNVDVTELLDCCRTLRHPAFLWDVDFVVPKPDMKVAKEIIKIIDEKIFISRDSIVLKENITADVYQLSAFHNIRCHTLAEENNAEAAIKIYKEFLSQHIESLSDVRKSTLLFSAATAFLSNTEYKLSLQCYEDLWVLLKYSTPEDRFKNGINDSFTLLNTVFWFFIKHVEEFREFLSFTFKTNTKEIWNHKKVSYLNILSDDHTWVVSLMGYGFYKHATTKMPTLPAYVGPKAYIPKNETHYIHEYTSAGISKYSGWQKIYFQKWGTQLSKLHSRSGEFNYFQCEDYKYSFLSFDNDNEKDIQQHQKLYNILNTTVLSKTKIETILYTACGNAPLYNQMISNDYKTTVLDISEQVCFNLAKQGINNIEHAPIEKYIPNMNKIDILFACDILSHIERNKIIDLINNCAKNINYICVLVELNNDIRDFDRLIESKIDLHQCKENDVFYINLIQKWFNILHHSLIDNELIIIGKNINLN